MKKAKIYGISTPVFLFFGAVIFICAVLSIIPNQMIGAKPFCLASVLCLVKLATKLSFS